MNERRPNFLSHPLFFILAAIVGGFMYRDRPDLFGALRSLGEQFSGDWSFPRDGAMGLLTVAVMWFGAAGVGHWMLYRFGAVERLRCFWARWALAPMCGWIPLSLATLAAGLAGQCSRAGLGLVMAAAAAFAVRGWAIFIADVRAWMAEGEGHDAMAALRLPPWMMTLLCAIYLLAIPYAMTPSVESDELRYHLAAPEAWIEAGRVHYLPYQAFSNFPFLIEMLYTMAMALQGAEGAKLVHLSFLEPCGILVALIAHLLITLTFRRLEEPRRTQAHNIAAFAGGAFAVLPCATILACWAFIDVAMASYFFAVVYLGALAIAERRAPPAWLLGLMAGGALGTKYSMAPLLAAMFGLLLLLALMSRGRGRRKSEAMKFLFRAGGIAALVASPWFVKNILWTGNPFYPLAWGVFGGGEWSAENAAFYAAKAAEKGFHAPMMHQWCLERGFDFPFLLGPAGRWIELAATPLTTSIFYERFEAHFLGPIPLMAMALAAAGVWLARSGRAHMPRPSALMTRRRAALLWIGGVIAGSWVFWFLTYQSNRMLLPTIGLVIAVGGWGMMMAWPGEAAPLARRLLAAVAAAAFVYSWAVGASVIAGGKRPFGVALGFERREDYLDRSLGYHASARWLEERLAPGERALLIGEHRPLYFGDWAVASDWFDDPQPRPLLRATKTNDDLVALLKKMGIHCIFFNRGEMRLFSDAYLKPRELMPPQEAAKFAALKIQPRLSAEEYIRLEALVGLESGRADPRLALIHKDARREILIYRLPESRLPPAQ